MAVMEVWFWFANGHARLNNLPRSGINGGSIFSRSTGNR